MHRHGYKGRKLSRERGQRRSLMRSMATSFIEEESIETTLPKAKELLPYVEKLITKAKKGGLHNRRQIISSLDGVDAAHKLVDDIAPKLRGRESGHLRIEKTRQRRGDGAQLAQLAFVDDLETEAPVKSTKRQSSSRSPAKKPSASTKKPASKGVAA